MTSIARLKRTLFLVFFITAKVLYAQDEPYAREIIKVLCSPEADGRGYVNGGETKAAFFIGNEYKTMGLLHFGNDYYQYFNIPVNTLPGKCSLGIDGQNLRPGRDFMVSASSPPVRGEFGLVSLEEAHFQDGDAYREFLRRDHSDIFILIDTARIPEKHRQALLDTLRHSNPFHSKGVVVVMDDLHWHVSTANKQKDYTRIDIKRGVLPKGATSLSADIEAKFYPAYLTQNVIGYLPGEGKRADSIIVVAAHYDHLGRMGQETYFPGAHDNASGVAMMADLAAHFSSGKLNTGYTLVFIAFGAEETGLLGSGFFVNNPLFPLNRIRFVVNIDLVGSGSKGIKVVNGTEHPAEFLLLKKMNEKSGYLQAIESRGPAANSDHYPFYARGVPAFFIYTLGDEYTEYHTVDDKAEGLPLTEYNDLFRLINDFITSL